MHFSRQTLVPGLFLMAALSCLSACGASPGPIFSDAGSTPSQTATPSQTPPPRPQEQPDLSTLSEGDRGILEHYLQSEGRDGIGEGSWVFAAPMTVEEAKSRLLGPSPEPATEADVEKMMNAEASAYAFLQVGDGVIAHEDTGFADPPRRLLAALSQGGAVSAVATDNIEAMMRFGYARDGQIVFDAFEYAFVEDLAEIPAEVRDLAALAWEDLDGPPAKTLDWFDVALAMSEKVTGVRADPGVYKVTEWYMVPLPWSAAEDG